MNWEEDCEDFSSKNFTIIDHFYFSKYARIQEKKLRRCVIYKL